MSKANSILSEIFLIIRFGMVGSVATMIHVLTLWALLSKATLSIFFANTISFFCAFGFSFIGNYLWTFGAPGSPKGALRRFFFISANAFLVNNVVLALVLRLGWIDSTCAALCSALVIPVITFLASRFWCFGYNRIMPLQ